MDHAEYVGPLRELRGKTALIIPDETHDLPLEQRTVRAQFDGDRQGDWRLPPQFKLKHPETGELLCYNWHTFPASHFKLLIPIPV